MTIKKGFTKILILAGLLVSFQNCAPVGKSISQIEATSSPEATTASKPRATTDTTITALKYSVTVDDPQNSLGADRDLILKNLQAALQDWGRYIYGQAPIRILVRINNVQARFSGASRTSVFLKTMNGHNVFEDIAPYKLRTGRDPEPLLPDIYIDINVNFMRQAYWIDPQPETRTLPVPAGKVDLVTVFAHELGHALGFNGFLNRSTGAVPADNGISVFDSLMYETNLSGAPVFSGAKTLTAYGSKLPVTFFTFSDSRTTTYSIAGVNYVATLHPSQNLTHYGRYTASNESPKSLQGLMGGAWLFRADQGLRIRVSDLDAAVLCDMGVPCRR